MSRKFVMLSGGLLSVVVCASGQRFASVKRRAGVDVMTLADESPETPDSVALAIARERERQWHNALCIPRKFF